MKKVVYGSLFALVATFGIVSCDKEEIKPVSSNSISLESNEEKGENEKVAEEIRLKFAANMVTFVNDTRETFKNVEYVHSLEKSGDNTAPTFEEFLAEIPGGDHLSEIGMKLMRESYDLHINNTSNEEILSNYNAEGYFLMAIEIINGRTIDNILFDKEYQNEKACDVCPKIWEGVKKAAAWTWENRKAIQEVIEWIQKITSK